METQTSMRGCESSPELDARVEALRAKVALTLHSAGRLHRITSLSLKSP
jgi:hypothetical protein